MRSSVRQPPVVALPGIVGTARVARRARDLVRRLKPGDIAVLDHLDMDRGTAQELVDAGVVAVVDASAIISGRFPNLGPQTLVVAGVAVVDSAGSAALAIQDGGTVRIHDGVVYDGERELAAGRVLDVESVDDEMARARTGMASHLEALTHSSTEFLRREQDLLLHGAGLPRPRTRVAGRPVVVVGAGPERAAELSGLRTYLSEQHPVLVGVGSAADALRAARLRPDIVVVDAGDELPSAATLRAARDVVVRLDRGSNPAVLEQLDRLAVRPLLLESGAAAEDAALVLADAGDPMVIVPVGMRATLEDLLDSRRPGSAGTYLTRLKVGPRLVDAAAVPHLYAGRVRPWHLVVLMLAGIVALAAAIAVTPVGQEWADSFTGTVADAVSDLYDRALGLFS